jgi:hypothetical protein
MNTVHYISSAPVASSPIEKVALIPSTTLVEERLKVLRLERAATLAAFRKEVEAAKIHWEAELLLALEELQESGGFADAEEKIKREITVERQNQRNRGGSHPRHSGGSSPISIPHEATNKLRSEIFLPDIFDIKQALLMTSTHNNYPLIRVGDPTFLTERADFRIQFLSSVIQQLYKIVEAQIDAKDAEDRALLEEQRKIQEKLRIAQQRHMNMGMSMPFYMETEPPMPIRRGR